MTTVWMNGNWNLAFTDSDYNELISYIEEEYDYQYAQICLSFAFHWL